MAIGVNNKVAYPTERYNYNDVGYSKFGVKTAQRPSLLLNFMENPTATGHGVVVTCARSTATATYFDRTRTLKTEIANVPRFSYDYLTGACLGLISETGGTNLMLRSRDLTVALVWNTATDCTLALDQTGLDGVASSASSMLATGADATCFQDITSVSAARVFSAYIKRLVGTGTISITLDGGATYTDVTASLLQDRFVRVRALQTVTNPEVGFKITTSGDKIAVDYCQIENNTIETTPILSTTGQGARQADNISILIAPWFLESAGTFFAEATASNGAQAVNQYICLIHDTTANERQIMYRATTKAPTCLVTDGTVTQATLTTGTWDDLATVKYTYAYTLNDFAFSFNGAAVATDTSGTLPTLTTFSVGVSQANTSHLNGYIRRLFFWPYRIANGMLVTLAT